MVSTPLKNISPNGNLPPGRGENKKYLKPPPSKGKCKVQNISVCTLKIWKKTNGKLDACECVKLRHPKNPGFLLVHPAFHQKISRNFWTNSLKIFRGIHTSKRQDLPLFSREKSASTNLSPSKSPRYVSALRALRSTAFGRVYCETKKNSCSSSSALRYAWRESPGKSSICRVDGFPSENRSAGNHETWDS